MSKEAMKLALEALESGKNHGVAIDVLRRALAEQPAQQEPVKHELQCICGCSWEIDADGNEELVSSPPAQQEPVDFASLLREAEELVREKPTWKRFIEGTPLSNDIAVWMTVFAQDVARRTYPPPQRTWVGLTDEEILELNFDGEYCIITDDDEEILEFARAIEATLRSKNT